MVINEGNATLEDFFADFDKTIREIRIYKTLLRSVGFVNVESREFVDSECPDLGSFSTFVLSAQKP